MHVSVVFGWTFVQILRMKICQKKISAEPEVKKNRDLGRFFVHFFQGKFRGKFRPKMLGKNGIFRGKRFEKLFSQEIPRNFPRKVLFRGK
jgi:hypothetical protein